MFCLVLAALLAVQADAPKPLPLQIPDGWESRTQDGVLLITPKELAEGKVCTVLVPPMTAKVGSLEGLLAAAKTTLGEIAKFTPLKDAVKGKSEGGWEYLFSIGTLEGDGRKMLGQAWGLRQGGEEGILLVLADSVETMEKYADGFGAMVRSIGAARPAPAAVAAKVDLKYTLPAGWVAKDQGETVLLEKWVNKGETFYGTERVFRLLILPSGPLAGGLRKAFLDTWAVQLKGTVESTIMPLPMVRRLKSGMAVAYDVDDRCTNKDGGSLIGGLYVLAKGNRRVSIAAFHSGFSDILEKDLLAFLESAEIPGAGDGKVALFSTADFAGVWSRSSATQAKYVTGAGTFAGSAAVSVDETFTLNADDTFKYSFKGVSSATPIEDAAEGKWKVEDDTLVLSGKGERRYVLYGVGSDAKVGHFLVKNAYNGSSDTLEISNPRRPLSGSWLKKKE